MHFVPPPTHASFPNAEGPLVAPRPGRETKWKPHQRGEPMPGMMGWRSALAVAAVVLAGCTSPPAEPIATDVVEEEVELPGLEAPVVDLPAIIEPVRRDPGVHAFDLVVNGETASGLLAVPESSPSTLVVVAHGWGGDAAGHRADLEAVAARGGLAVAMDYRGDRGAFKVLAGVQDTVAATLLLQAEYPGIRLTMLYGWSMGGEIAFLAPLVAPPGTYDYVFSGAGVMDLESFWHEAPLARAAIENETGGPPTEVPAQYVARSPRAHATQFAKSGVARVFLVHGAADWPVPVEHAELMYTALEEAGQPVSYYVVTKDRDDVCLLDKCQPATLAAGHTAGEFRLMRPFIEHRMQGFADPAEPAVRGTYDGETGKYDPSDIG